MTLALSGAQSGGAGAATLRYAAGAAGRVLALAPAKARPKPKARPTRDTSGEASKKRARGDGGKGGR